MLLRILSVKVTHQAMYCSVGMSGGEQPRLMADGSWYSRT